MCQFPALKELGFLEAVVQRMLAIHSDKVYMSQWRLFWCRPGAVSVTSTRLKATSVLVCEFLMYLFNDRKLQAKSIAGYKPAISIFLKRALSYDLSTCTVVADLLRSFYRERLPPPRVVVKWDIPTVLRFLQSAIFNPDVITQRVLTLKAIFLFVLGLGRRRSELQALERGSVCCYVCFCYVPYHID